jgi:hypothetical protein
MPPKILKVNSRVIGLVAGNKDERGTITGFEGNCGQKRGSLDGMMDVSDLVLWHALGFG